MSLERGLYFIFSGSKQVGRHPIEDRSMHPKRVFALPPGVRPLGPWHVEPTVDGHYRLRALGALTAEDQGLLWAFLRHEDKDFAWVVTPRGGDYYTVEKPARDVGWVAACEDGPWGTQIAVKLLTSIGSDQLFKFIRADRDVNID